ncbi:MAG: ABC transporter permease [Oscillospiraceae bacterium]|nr:ABC transporter permease [Oscillospiraceae bacterium]
MISKISLLIAVRKMRSHIPQLLGLILLLTVGVCFFITLFTIVFRYEETAEKYISDYDYADVTFYGRFNDESVKALRERGVIAEGRTVQDFRDLGENALIFRAVSLTNNVNIPYIYEGVLPENSDECLLLKRNAAALGIAVGDMVTIGGKTLTVTGISASPEYIYMVQNERIMMAQPDCFAVVYVVPDFFEMGYNEIVVIGDAGDFVPDGTFQAITRSDYTNYILYRNDLSEIGSFAYIFPTIFSVLIAAVIYVMLLRSIQKDRRQIGTMKALGMSDGKIIGIYLSQFCIAALIGALLGGAATIFICDLIIDIFSAMFEVPTLSFAFYPILWFGAMVVSVLLCAISGLIALTRILPLLPAHAMRPRIPKSGRKILLEHAEFIWKRLTFNTRYALKNTLRNKSRFFAVVLGMCGSCALLTFSLGFYNSITRTQDEYFDGFANYDIIINFEPIPHIFENAEQLEISQIDESFKALVMPVKILDDNYILAITEEGFDMVNIPAAELQNGVIIPEYFAKLWKVKVGDKLDINGYTAVISAITPQHLGLTMYTSFDYAKTIIDELPPVYNTIYARSGDMAALTEILIKNNIDFATIADDNTSFDSIMESMSVLIWFMIFCSVVLGFTVLYSVGLINLSAREYEYMFMGVMGESHRRILTAHVKETLLQLVIAVPLGFLSGNLILDAIKGEFSNSSFVISAAIFPQSYVAAALAVIGVTAVMTAVTSRHIKGLDIVEGLKGRDE